MIDLEQDLGLNIPDHEDNPISRKKAYVEALQDHVLGKDIKGEDVKLTEAQSKYLYDESRKAYSGAGVKQNYWNSEYKQAYNSFQADVKRGRGEYTTTSGGDLGNGFGMKGHLNATRGSLLASGFLDSAQVTKEGLANSLGFATAQQRRQFKTGGILGKGMTAGTVGIGAYSLISTGINGGDMYDALTDNVATAGGMAGFHAGSKLSGALFSKESKKSRFASSLLGGAVGGFIGSQIFSGVMSGARDLTSSDSQIVKTFKGFSQLPGATGSIEQNTKTLTMRQKALQQLNQNSMNDRASILGSEASILRGYM